MAQTTLSLALMIVFGAATSHAQTPTPANSAIAGTWVGGLERGNEWELYSATIEAGATLTGVGRVPLRGLSAPLRSVRVDGNRVRIEGPASVVLSGILDGDTLAGDAEVQGRTDTRFRLMRFATIQPTALARYQGVYEFADGRVLLVQRADVDGLPMPSALDGTGIPARI